MDGGRLERRTLTVSHVERTALALLRPEFGIRTAVRIRRRLRVREKDGEPFGDLLPSPSRSEREARAEVGGAVRLYRELFGMHQVDDPERWTALAIEEGAGAWWRASYGRGWLREQGEDFAGGTVRWDVWTEEEVRFTVTACRLVELCRKAGEPKLAPFFCRADARHFGAIAPRVVLVRDRTIAAGGDDCPFLVRFDDTP